MIFYCGIDLHSKKSQVCIIDKNGKKVKTDRRDALKLTKLLRMGEIPKAYIYPKEKDP